MVNLVMFTTQGGATMYVNPEHVSSVGTAFDGGSLITFQNGRQVTVKGSAEKTEYKLRTGSPG